MKIHADFTRFASAHFNSTKYIPSPAYGVNRFMLDRIGDEKARATTIVEYQPDSHFPSHTHIGGEEYLVLAGSFHDEYGAFPTGSYVRNPIGSQHAPWVEDDGCTILVKLLQMAEDGMTEPLHVKVAPSFSTPTPFGGVQELYQSSLTGEKVQVCWIDPDTLFRADSDATDGGEEIFVIAGSILIVDEEFCRWDWLRFPVGGDERRATLRAGQKGAQIWRKMGHLNQRALSLEKIQILDDEAKTT